MSITAIIPVANLAAANATLASQGYGPGNFSVPAYSGPGATHAVLHCWDNGAFAAAVRALPGVTVDETGSDPAAAVAALTASQSATWGERAPVLPATGNVTAGALFNFDGSLWYVIQTFSRTTYSAHPSTYPALIRRVRSPYAVEPHKTPIDQYDAYKLVNPFTGQPDRCIEGGNTYATLIDNNVWSPSGYPAGWAKV